MSSIASLDTVTTQGTSVPLIVVEPSSGREVHLVDSQYGHIKYPRKSQSKEKKREKKKRMKSRLEKFLVVAVVVLLVALVVFAINFFRHLRTDRDRKSFSAVSPVCITAGCTKTAARVIEAMDPSVDPCQNFYDFACGGWIQVHEIPEDRPNLFAFSLLREQVTNTLRKSLEKHIEPADIESVVNVKKLYQSCVNEDLIEQQNLTAMYRLLEEMGGYPLLGDGPGGNWIESRFDMVQLILSLLKYNNQPVAPIWVGVDDRNNTRRVVTVDQQWLGMPNRDYFLDPLFDMLKTAYRKLMVDVSVMLGADPTAIDQEVTDILELETELARILVPANERRKSSALYNKMTIRQLMNLTDKVQADRLRFDWLRYINGALHIPNVKQNVTEDEEVVVISLPYYQQLWPVLARFPKRTIVNYMVWRLVKNRAVNLPRRFRKQIDLFNQALYGLQTSPARWKECVNYIQVTFEMVVGRLFVQSSFNNASRAEAIDMIQHVRTAFKDRVDALDWMDAHMKAVAKEKADSIVELVGYPDFILDDGQLDSVYADMPMNSTSYFDNVLTVLQRDARDALDNLRITKLANTSRLEWSSSPVTVNAFYSLQKNQISFPAGILQPPYYSIEQPRSMNYGGIGFMMGHEITHGFDDRGREYNKDGNLQDWWTVEAADIFRGKAQCLIQQYGTFVSPEAGLNVDGVLTQGENIADNGAVKQAFRAYRKWVAEVGSEEPLLPGLNYTHDQLFFINLAQIRCGLQRPESAQSDLQTGVHSPNRFRVIGSLMNFDEFSRVFNCPLNSYMNPAKKCSIW